MHRISDWLVSDTRRSLTIRYSAGKYTATLNDWEPETHGAIVTATAVGVTPDLALTYLGGVLRTAQEQRLTTGA